MKQFHLRTISKGSIVDFGRMRLLYVGKEQERFKDAKRNLEKIEQARNDNPRLSTRSAEIKFQISRYTIRNVLRTKLIILLFQLSCLNELLLNDYAERLQRGWNSRREVRHHSKDLARLVVSDDWLFHMNETVNKHNARISSTENPETVYDVSRRSKNVMVWCAVHKKYIIGHCFSVSLLSIVQHIT